MPHHPLAFAGEESFGKSRHLFQLQNFYVRRKYLKYILLYILLFKQRNLPSCCNFSWPAKEVNLLLAEDLCLCRIASMAQHILQTLNSPALLAAAVSVAAACENCMENSLQCSHLEKIPFPCKQNRSHLYPGRKGCSRATCLCSNDSFEFRQFNSFLTYNLRSFFFHRSDFQWQHWWVGVSLSSLGRFIINVQTHQLQFCCDTAYIYNHMGSKSFGFQIILCFLASSEAKDIQDHLDKR